jgi:hypothetical protein
VIAISRWARIFAAAGAGLAVSWAIASPGSARTINAASTVPGGLIYVANLGAGSVTAYPAGSTGSVAPVRTIGDPGVSGTVWDPWGVTFDVTGHLYVQSFIANADTFVFPPGANGGTAPTRVFEVQGPDNSSIAVDARGFAYVLGGELGSTIAVASPGASGTPGNGYFVPPVRTISLDGSFNPWPDLLTVDSRNEVLAAVGRPQVGNAIEVFAGGAAGAASPLRVISGPDTGLDSCSPPCKAPITVSRLTGQIYAAVSTGPATHISVFAGNANGDARPLRTIEGPATGLAGMVITGIAVSPFDGTIYVMVKSSQLGTGSVLAYSRFANGNAAPARTFTDSGSGFANAAGIAIAPW